MQLLEETGSAGVQLVKNNPVNETKSRTKVWLLSFGGIRGSNSLDIRKKQEKEQQVTARSLNLITNIVLVWNTIYIQIIKQLRDEGYHIDEDDLRRISPAPFEHINRLGKYDFKDEIRLENNGFRALRIPGEEN